MSERRILRSVEILSVLVIVGTIVGMSVPKRAEMRRAAEARTLLEDVEVVRQSVYAFYSDSAYFPRQEPGLPIPAGLATYLPRGFAVRKPYGTLDYRNWPMAVKDSAVTSATNVVGVTVTVFDSRIGAAADARARDIPRFVLGNKYTFLFFGG